MVLLILTATRQDLAFGTRAQRVALWPRNAGHVGIFTALFLAAAWGTAESTPIAGAGHGSTEGQEPIVDIELRSVSVATIVAPGSLLAGASKARKLHWPSGVRLRLAHGLSSRAAWLTVETTPECGAA